MTPTATITATATATATLTIRGSWYRAGSLWIVVLTGMPEQSVRIGTGDTVHEAWGSLETTAIQSVGRDSGERAALEWAAASGWIEDTDALESADDDAAASVKSPVGDVEWSDDAYGYVACCYGVDGDEPGDCTVRVGEDGAGLWWVDSGDDDHRDAPTGPYDTEDLAREAAGALADEQHEGEDGEDAETMAARRRDAAAGQPVDTGAWCVWWFCGDDSRADERYATEDQATAAAARAQAGLESGNPGTHLLCGYEVRQLVGGQWVASGQDS